jgi:DNA-binding LacI/PurR family transcriptional regulator
VVSKAREAGTPVVILNRQERVEGVSLVWIDAPEAGRAVAKLMQAEGRRRPLAVATNPVRSRELQAFAEAMEAGGSEPCRWIDTAFRYEDGLRAAEEAFGQTARPDCIFTASDNVAIGLIDSARRLHGLDVPRDLSVVGFGDTNTAGWMSHMISTVRLPITSMIQTAISTLMSRIASAEEPAPRIWLGCDVIQRSTTIGGSSKI